MLHFLLILFSTTFAKDSTTQIHSDYNQKSTYQSANVENTGPTGTTSADPIVDEANTSKESIATPGLAIKNKYEISNTYKDDHELWSHSMKSSSTHSQLESSAKPRQK